MKNFSIVKNWKVFFAITFVFLMIGYGSMIFRGFNLGIDFTGGSIMDLKFEKPAQVAQVREVMSRHDLGAAVIQLEGSDSTVTSSQGVLIRTPVIADKERTRIMSDMEQSLGKFEIRRVENVGATIGRELIMQAAIAIFLSWVLMILYITMRFQLNFALAAIFALMIDVSVTLSWFSLLQLEIDSAFVAALLTVVGYSVNGTIVIFDRIRENMRVHRRSETVTDMIDNSIKSTLTRTVYTTLTTLFAIVAIFLFGGNPSIIFPSLCWLVVAAALIHQFCWPAHSGCFFSIKKRESSCIVKKKNTLTHSQKMKMRRVFIFNFTDGGSSKTAYRKGVSRPYGKRRSEVKGQRCETGFTGRPYNNHARCGMVIIERTRLLLQPGWK